MILYTFVFCICFAFYNISKNGVVSKYVEGHLKTLEDWAFVARFCFLSGKGRYEYHIEFERRYGEPQLLLYYDDDTQWPAIYKTGKTCLQKLSVLSVRDNQIVTLSARSPFNVLSGCTLRTSLEETEIDSDDSNNNNNNNKNSNSGTGSQSKPKDSASSSTNNNKDNKNTNNKDDEWNYTYYGQFLKTTPSTPYESSGYASKSSGTTTPASSFSSDDKSTWHYDYDFNVTSSTTSSSSFNDTVESFNLSSSVVYSYVPLGKDAGGFVNAVENNTHYMEYVEELFGANGGTYSVLDNESQASTGRVKRAPWKSENPATLYVSCRSSGGFITARERWWYIAIANCGGKKGIDVKYKFRMTNGPPGDFWHEHFSADEMYIPPILLAESICYTFLMLAIFICAIELKSRHLFHCTYRLFTASASLQYMGALFSGVAWAKYAITGLGPHNIFGTLLQGASETSFLALLLLMAKGYTITRARLSTCSTIKLMTFINVYVIVYIALFIYREEVFDPGEVLNLYESPAGLALSGLRCGAWGAFLISAANTVKKFPEKSNFYYPFGLLGSVWILGGPILVFIGISFFDAWVRESVMCAVFAILAFSGHASFLWLTWPSRANISFPYHVRTNHVGIMSTEDDGADYPRHVYEPSMEDQNIIVPLSRRTEELLNGVYSQYLCERDNYNSATTPHSHASFPTAPPVTPSIQPIQEESTTIESPDDTPKEDKANSSTSTPENQRDSGHSSFDNESTSDKPITPPKQEEKEEEEKDKEKNEMEIFGEEDTVNGGKKFDVKSNPFLISGVKSPPNKIILDPINPPVKSSPGDVPKHLFAAKRPTNQ